MKIAIASGKGGTGKTTIAVNLAKNLAQQVQLVDCDVEEPNCHLFLHGDKTETEVVNLPMPEIITSRCDGCGECSDFCEFNALATFGGPPVIFPELCHACGGCRIVCTRKAIVEVDKRIGIIDSINVDKITFLQGVLDIGVQSAVALVDKLKQKNDPSIHTIFDAPPGTSCPVVATLQGVDYVLLVTEPTPFGLNDLKLAVLLVRELKIPFGVIVNRMGIGDRRVHEFCEKDAIPILMEIPDDRRIAEAYSKGHSIVDVFPEYQNRFKELSDSLFKNSDKKNGGNSVLRSNKSGDLYNIKDQSIV
ncbi:ATP-binding protein [bacterium]|nr:ATP-binding protein [bacterium]